MHKRLFLRIMEKIIEHDDYFQQNINVANKRGASLHIKITAALWQLTYSAHAYSLDEYFQFSGTTATKSLKNFCSAVINVFGWWVSSCTQWRRNQTITGRRWKVQLPCHAWISRLYALERQNGPKALHGHYIRKEKVAAVVLQAVASKDRCIWHTFFGLPGSLNDINVLQPSPLSDNLIHGRIPPVNFIVNGHEYNMEYNFADGIYPRWWLWSNRSLIPNHLSLKYESIHPRIKAVYTFKSLSWYIMLNVYFIYRGLQKWKKAL